MSDVQSRDRPANNPGDILCANCECSFVGEVWHALCRVCVEEFSVVEERSN